MSAWVQLASPGWQASPVEGAGALVLRQALSCVTLCLHFLLSRRRTLLVPYPRVVGVRASALGRRARRTWWALNIGPSFFAVFVFGAVYTVDLGGKD